MINPFTIINECNTSLPIYTYDNSLVLFTKIIHDVYDKYKDIKYDGYDFKNENIICNINNEIDCFASVKIYDTYSFRPTLIEFNLLKIIDNVNKYNLNPELYITYILFHEYSHIWMYREPVNERNEVNELFIETLSINEDAKKLFSKYTQYNYLLKEVLCDSTAIDIAKTYLSPSMYMQFISSMKFMISYYDHMILNGMGYLHMIEK